MRYIIYITLSALVILAACGKSKEQKKQEALNQISALKDSLKTHKSAEKLKRDAKKLKNELNDYVEKYPKDSLTPSYLYTIGNLQFNYLQNPKKAIDNFEKMRKSYPDHEKAPIALFTQGFLYEKLRKPEMARKKYQQFLDEYPDHQLAQDVKLSMKGLGMTNEEQLEQAKKRREQRARQRKDTLEN